MSCYIVEDRHIYFLASIMLDCQLEYKWGGQTNCINTVESAVKIADQMMRENHSSYFARYREVVNMDPINAAYIRPVTHSETTIAQVVKSIDCYTYQACEHDGWSSSQAREACFALREVWTRGIKLYAGHHGEEAKYPLGWGDAEWGCCPNFQLKERSPMMQQWDEIRGQLDPDVALLWRLGDFYELFECDAERFSPWLEIVVTRRHDIPMSGIPAWSLDEYVKKFHSEGISVAIVDTVERDGKQVRELTEIRKPPPVPQLEPAELKASAYIALRYLDPYLPTDQAKVIKQNIRSSEESEYFQKLVCDLCEQFMFAPRTYGQDGVEDPIAYFHYFRGGYDCYVTELDIGDPEEPEDRTQRQVRALARFDHMPEHGEIGYVYFPELFEAGIELDLHWEPKPISECRTRHIA